MLIKPRLKEKICRGCNTLFMGTKDRKYCCDECRERIARQRAAAARATLKEEDWRMPAGQWGLAVDPWATGQLPESVQRNALV